MRTSDFDYDLPPEQIAQYPLADRAASRLLVVRRESGSTEGGTDAAEFQDAAFGDLVSLIPAGDLLVINTTRVRHARLPGTRPSGAPAEVLLIHPAADETWIAIGRPGSALRPGKRIGLGQDVWVETLEVLPEGYRRVRFIGADAGEAMARFGRLPLPPYIDRAPEPGDDVAYQTVYAEREGSVAAPTAGLHFTPAVLGALAGKGVRLGRLELDVGPGTFKPVETEDPGRHPMHPERYEIPPALAAQVAETRDRGGRIWAVGTTVVRALESAAAAGGRLTPGPGETRLLILPGYRFTVVDHLLTNFHLPRSTLLMLVSALAGTERTMRAYRHAVAKRYRFYSYGDAMVII
ncbi:MAG: tRNA preQ1(34) S-adenosylmethionine ribosyltransferase-isomerase QueA [Gemmatimonadales bacterium]